MYFKFNVNLTDKDYLDYNTFWMIKSPYGKKQMLRIRLWIAVCIAIVSFGFLLNRNFSVSAWIGVIPFFILLGIFQLLLNPFMVWILKDQVKSLRKKGKLGYSPNSEMEFFDDTFTETTSQTKSEQNYSSIERISVIQDRMIYIHVNTAMSYLLPASCFDYKEQYDAFLNLIKTKCPNVDIY